MQAVQIQGCISLKKKYQRVSYAGQGEGKKNQLFVQKLLLIGLFLPSKISVEMCVLVWKFEAL